ncbi:MAG: 2-oxo acid dehydrogenase subunit E2 [Chloroflexi bacterium]|nr:2-oxo acid dehydrogenase subunit E2 [Chloroflexota bacterium]
MSATTSSPPARSSPPLPEGETNVSSESRPLTPMRRAIAEHMARARAEIPDAWSLTEIDLTNVVRQRQRLQAEWQAREGYELTYLPFFVKAVLVGLRAVPELNATFAGDHIVLHREYHLGIAVSVENGLLVPVLRGADQLSVAGIARALRGIVQKARSGKLGMDDLQGATFTVNNPGSLGSIMSQPIVPVSQAGIVTMEAVVKRPIVTADDAIAVRSMMNSCLSFDHRVLDGAGALTFLRTIKTQLETVELPLY